METDMNIRHLSLATGLLLMTGAGAAIAQTVVIAPEQQTVIREYVTTHQVAPVQLPSDFQVTVGAALPDTVEVHALDVPDLDTKYSYVVVDGRTVLVEPDTRKIVQIID
jgi:hypothetical protein